ncbi:HalD/BesD family halogenase [Micromonospora sp. NPDC003241]
MEASVVDPLARLAAHEVSSEQLTEAREHLAKYGFTKVSFVVPEELKETVATEVLNLVGEAGVRRDLRFAATGNTLRRMRNVRRDEVAERSTVIPAVYESEALLALLSKVAGEAVLPCPYEPEQYVITRLEESGDTHGWHWDDYAFALVWIIECPAVEHGGFVQCVPGTTWNKENPEIHRAFLAGPTYSASFVPGDLYLMRTDTTLHRVYPITGGVRTIINMGYAATTDLDRHISHETMDALWAESSPAAPPIR